MDATAGPEDTDSPATSITPSEHVQVSHASSQPPASAAPAATVAASSAGPLPGTEPSPPQIREDQVQNAVGFLSHPQVRSSTNTASKRSFLERKGLTAAEIDDAFRRVPEAAAPSSAPPPAPAPQPPVAYAHPSQQQPLAPGSLPQQLQLPQQQAALVPHAGYNPPAAQPGSGPATMIKAPGGLLTPQSYRWSQIVLGVGVVAAAGWAVHQLVVPRLRALVDSWHASRREEEEARQKALTAALDGLTSCQEELKTSTQALVEAVSLMREQQQQQQQRAAAAAEGAAPRGRAVVAPGTDPYYATAGGRPANGNGRGYGNGNGTGDILSADTFANLRAAAGSYTNTYPPDALSSYSYGRDSGPAAGGNTGGGGGGGAPMYGMPSQQSFGAVRTAATGPYGGNGGGTMTPGPAGQENLPYKVTTPPSPAQSSHSLQTGRQQPPPGPGPGPFLPSGPSGTVPQQQQQQQVGYGGSGGGGGMVATSIFGSSDRLYDGSAHGPAASPDGGRTVPRPPPEQPAYPQSFHEVMEMVQKGITPPNVRTDINDSPPDPTRPLSEARMPAPSKPWERGGGAAAVSGASAGGCGSPYGMMAPSSTTSRSASGMYGWPPPQADATASPSPGMGMPPTSYGVPYGNLATAGPSGGSAVGRSSNSGGGGSGAGGGGGGAGGSGSSSGLSVLPPVNPAWRPPPPPARTVTSSSSNPASPPSLSSTGMAPGSGSGGTAPPPAGGEALADPAAAVGAAGLSIAPFPAAPPARAVSEPPPPPLGAPAAFSVAAGPALTVIAAEPGAGAAAAGAVPGSGDMMAPTSPTPSQPPFAPSGGELAAREAFVADGPAPTAGGEVGDGLAAGGAAAAAAGGEPSGADGEASVTTAGLDI